MSAGAPPSGVLFVGRGGPIAQQLVVTGLANGFRLHSVATATEALGHLGQVLFDAVVYEASDQAVLGRALSGDVDLARVPTLVLLGPGDVLEQPRAKSSPRSDRRVSSMTPSSYSKRCSSACAGSDPSSSRLCTMRVVEARVRRIALPSSRLRAGRPS